MPECPDSSTESGFHSKYFRVQLYYTESVDNWEETVPTFLPGLPQTSPVLRVFTPMLWTHSLSSLLWMTTDRIKKCPGHYWWLYQAFTLSTQWVGRKEKKKSAMRKQAQRPGYAQSCEREANLSDRDWVAAWCQSESLHSRPSERLHKMTPAL